MSPIIPLLFLLLLQLSSATALRLLHEWYYNDTCPHAESIVQNVLRQAMCNDTRSPASIMRLQFHDCLVNGCDGSLLLDDTAEMVGEKLALSNINSLRSYEVIDHMKNALEEKCPGVVSCADIIIMAAKEAVVLSGGPNWEVKLGRLDSLNASQQASSDIMPSPSLNASRLITFFNQFNLTTKDLVALSGSHTVGRARCYAIIFRLYYQSVLPDPAMNSIYRKKLERVCTKWGNMNVTLPFDHTEKRFDNQYYKGLINGTGFLNSDQTLYTSNETKGYVKMFARSQTLFFKAFVEGMIKLGNLQSGEEGEIRKNCRVVNTKP